MVIEVKCQIPHALTIIIGHFGEKDCLFLVIFVSVGICLFPSEWLSVFVYMCLIT